MRTNRLSVKRTNRIFYASQNKFKTSICSLMHILLDALLCASDIVYHFYEREDKRQKYSGFFNKHMPNGMLGYTAIWSHNRQSCEKLLRAVKDSDIDSTSFNDSLYELVNHLPIISEYIDDVTNTFVFRDVIIDDRHITLINSEIDTNLIGKIKIVFDRFCQYMLTLNAGNRFIRYSGYRNKNGYLSNSPNHGVMKGTNYRTNINAHLSKHRGSLVNIDVTKFFDTFTLNKMIQHGYFYKSFMINCNFLCVNHSLSCNNQLQEENKQTLLLYNRIFLSIIPFFLHNGKLPTGMTYSAALANFLFSFIDKEIYAYLLSIQQKSHGITIAYTRYIDDITISSSYQKNLNGENVLNINVIKDIEKILNEFGFYLNYDKTKIFSSKETKQINGLIYGGSNAKALSVTSKYKYDLAKDFDLAGSENQKLNTSQLGKLAYVNSVNKLQAAYCASHYLKYFDLARNDLSKSGYENIHQYRRAIEAYLDNHGTPYDISVLTHVGQ